MLMLKWGKNLTPDRDVFIDLAHHTSVGLNACSVRNLTIQDHNISFALDAATSLRTVRIRFSGLDKTAQYRIVWNGNASALIHGAAIVRNGFTIRHK